MSPDPKDPLNGDWHVYRYNISSRVVLKSPKTMLGISPPMPPDEEAVTRTAQFELSGWDHKVQVLMDKAGPGKAGAGHYPDDQETKTDTWFGEYENFDFRWDRHYGQPGILIGYAADRLNPMSRDTFVAVKSEKARKVTSLHTYAFRCCYLTPLARTRPSQKGTVSIDVKNRVITFGGTSHKILTDISYDPQGGRRLTAINTEELKERKELGLWLLPIDGPGGPIAIGCYVHHHDPDGPTVPGNKECGFVFQLC